MRTSSLPRRRVIRAHMSRVAKTCRNVYKVKHQWEYPDHTVCTTITEISQNPASEHRC
ncbi:hypothetical protein BE221DRAFT_172608, partial [Ostreococcus tauri]